MPEQMKRKKIRCYNCGEIFTLLMDIAGEPTRSITCPFCGASLTVTLAKYPKKVITVYRTDVGGSSTTEMVVYD